MLYLLPEAVFFVDADGVIRLWNRAAQTITALSEGGVLGRPANDVIPAWSIFKDSVPVADEPKPIAARCCISLPVDGRAVFLSVAAARLREGTLYTFYEAATDRDGSDESRLMMEFIGPLIHELRSRLTSVRWAINVAQAPSTDQAGPEPRLDVASGEASRMDSILADVSTAIRLGTGALTLRRESFGARQMAKSVIECARARVLDAAVVVVEVDAPDRDPEVVADPGKVRQVLVNLLENAVKYSPSGGEVLIRISVDDDEVRFEVRDHGLGICATDHDRIFEKRFRSEPDAHPTLPGTGLGLFICRELAGQMHGRLSIESSLGVGSTVTLALPRRS